MSDLVINSIRQINNAANNLMTKKALIVNNEVNINGKITSNGTELVPIGFIVAFAGTTAPPGWAICNGQQGTPDLRGRAVIGTGTARAYNTPHGSETVQLSAGQLPKHNHGETTSANGNHTHTYRTAADSGWGSGTRDAVVLVGAVDGGVGINELTHNHGVSSYGKSNAHNNMQPYIALNYIMRIR
jgi:microcystin-dependent protein